MKQECTETLETTEPNESPEIKVYREFVKNNAKDRSTEVFANAGAQHASIVMSTMFDSTDKSVKMLVGNLIGDVSGKPEYLNSLTTALDKGISFEVIFLDNPHPNSKAYKILREAKNDNKNVTLKKARPIVLENIKAGRKKFGGGMVHFSVFDKDKYRFEKNPENFGAWCSFNAPENAGILLTAFERYSQDSDVIN